MEIFSLLPLELQQPETSHSIEALEMKVLEMLRRNSDELMNILYRIDLSESKLQAAFISRTDTKIASEITQLIVERLNQKLETRRKFGSV